MPSIVATFDARHPLRGETRYNLSFFSECVVFGIPNHLDLQRAKTLGFRHFQTAELRLPLVEGRRADPVATAYLDRRHARLLLLQNPDNLLFAEPAALHAVRLFFVGLYPKPVTSQGSTSTAKAIYFGTGEALRPPLPFL